MEVIEAFGSGVLSGAACILEPAYEGARRRSGGVECLYMSNCSRNVPRLVWFARQWVVGCGVTVLFWGGC